MGGRAFCSVSPARVAGSSFTCAKRSASQTHQRILTAANNSQRAYRAPCPGCGAPVDFLSAQSTHAVCAYCQSTVVRQGEVLSRLGKMAELFDDHSPLQLQARGTWRTRGFTLIGRLQYQTPEGVWSEWHVLFDDGGSGWLSEDNGAYVMCVPLAVPTALPEAARFALGMRTTISGKPFTVGSNQKASLRSAQGELPRMPALGAPFDLVELRGPDGKVVSLQYGEADAAPTATEGSSVLLEELGLSGLRDDNAKTETGRQFNCPHCGAPVTVALANSKSITCPSCHSLIDLSQGIGGELRAATQDEPVTPLIALGTVGTLQGLAWQVVGFQHRMGKEPGDDEEFGWSEYLLYNQKRGFTFLVDSEEGWSLVRPIIGTPTMANKLGTSVQYLGNTYALKYRYSAETYYVAGEFYWVVHRGQRTNNADYASGKRLLSQEQGGSEVLWSSGEQIPSDTVAKAFALDASLTQRGPTLASGARQLFSSARDASPLSGSSSTSWTQVWLWIAIILVVILLERCDNCDPRVENCSSRTSGGSFGGWSGGGGHK